MSSRHLKTQVAKSRVTGFSLIEVLIAMLILSFGILSMGGLQLASLKSNQISNGMSQAAVLARDYAELMRSNYTVSNAAGTTAYMIDTSGFSATSVNCLGTGTACSAADLANLHVADWVARVNAQLPGARAVVCHDPSPRNANGTYRWGCGTNDAKAVSIKIGWVDKRSAEERGTTTVSATPTVPQFVLGGFTGYAE